MDPLYTLKRALRVRERIRPLLPMLDLATAVPTALGGMHFYALKRLGLSSLTLNRKVLDRIGIFPVRDHYYEPYFSARHLRRPLDVARDLPGLELGTERGARLLRSLGRYGSEPIVGPLEGSPKLRYEIGNGTYGLPDASIFYAMVRTLRPRRLVEIGGGNSTLVALRALARNRQEGSPCEHTCIEPFEMPWLERTGTRIVRSIVEHVDPRTFEALEDGDVLFVDNSHMIRPQGDVLYIVQELLPRLKPGVVVHIHDIFSPYDYPESWLIQKMLLWNEQYLVEAFLTCNERFEVLIPSYALFKDRRDAFDALRPELRERRDWMEPTSLWLRRKPDASSTDPLTT